MIKDLYINFPIDLLEDDIQKAMNNILDYAICRQAQNLRQGTEIDKINAAIRFFQMNGTNPQKVYENGEKILSKYLGRKPITASVKKTMILEFMFAHKTDFEIDCFRVFCAIKSILGNKDMAYTNKNYIVSRAFKNSPQLQVKYSIRYHIDKVLQELETTWGLKRYSKYERGIYVSFKTEKLELEKISLLKKQRKCGKN